MRAWTVGSAILCIACGDDAPPSADDSTTGSTTAAAAASESSTGAGSSTAALDETSGESSGTTGGGASSDETGSGGSTTGEAPTIGDPIRVVYVADEAAPEIPEAWLIDEAGLEAGPQRVNQPLRAQQSISPITQLSPDHRWLLYRTLGPIQPTGIWLVDMARARPGEPIQIADGAREFLATPMMSPDGTHVAWVAGAERIDVAAITDAGPTPAMPFTPAMTPGGSIITPVWSPQSDALVTIADFAASDVGDLWRIDLARPGTAIRLSDLTAPGTTVQNGSILWPPDAAHVLYRADRDVPEPELFFVDLQGATPGAPQKVNVPIVEDNEDLQSVRAAPDGSAVTYWIGTAASPPQGTLRMASLIGGVQASLDVHAGEEGTALPSGSVWSPSASHFAYAVQVDVKGGEQIQGWVVPVSAGVAGPPERFTGATKGLGAEVQTAYFTPDAPMLVYFAETSFGTELFAVDLSEAEPADPVKAHATFDAPGWSGDLRFSNDGTRILLTGRIDSAQTRDLYVIERQGDPPWEYQRINDPLPSGGGIGPTPIFAGNNDHVLFTDDSRGGRDLWDAWIPGDAAPLAVMLSGGGTVSSWREL